MTKEERKAIRSEKRKAKIERKLDRKEKIYQEKYGVSYREVVKSDDRKKEKQNKKLLNSLFASEKKVIVICYSFIALLSILAFLPVYFFQKYNTYLSLGSWDEAIKVILLYIACSLFTEICYTITYYFLRKLTNKIIFKIRNKMAKKLLNSKYESFKLLNSGAVLNKLTSNLTQYITNTLNLIQRYCDVVEDIGIIIYSTIISPWLSLILLGFGTIRWLVHFAYEKEMQIKIRKRNNLIGDKYSGLNNESIRGMQDVKLLNIKDKILNSLEKINKNSLNSSDNENRLETFFSALNNTIMIAKNTVFFIAVILFLRDNLVTLGTVMMLFTYRGRYENLFSNFNTIRRYKNIRRVSGDRLCEILDDENFPVEVFGDKTIKKVKGKIEFKNVTFAYKDVKNKNESAVLDKVNFVINPNECVGIVGESGAGKTTIINLIPRLFDCDGGKVLLDNKDVKTLDEKTLRGSVSVVSQNPYIFNMSFAENLRIVKEDATDEELIEISKKVNLDKVILEREEGLSTKLGEGGLQLSGGQRQRLAIARALLTNSKILIFDEATSALDNENQKDIQDVIAKLQGDHTIIIIAHRLSTIVNCDKLIFIHDGKVVAEGTHKELMKNCEEYYNLYKYEN